MRGNDLARARYSRIAGNHSCGDAQPLLHSLGPVASIPDNRIRGRLVGLILLSSLIGKGGARRCAAAGRRVGCTRRPAWCNPFGTARNAGTVPSYCRPPFPRCDRSIFAGASRPRATRLRGTRRSRRAQNGRPDAEHALDWAGHWYASTVRSHGEVCRAAQCVANVRRPEGTHDRESMPGP